MRQIKFFGFGTLMEGRTGPLLFLSLCHHVPTLFHSLKDLFSSMSDGLILAFLSFLLCIRPVDEIDHL